MFAAEHPVQRVGRLVDERFRVDDFAGVTCYRKRTRPKVVLFWHMTRVDDLPFEPNKEVDEVRWLPAEEALALLSYEAEREVVRGRGCATAEAAPADAP